MCYRDGTGGSSGTGANGCERHRAHAARTLCMVVAKAWQEAPVGLRGRPQQQSLNVGDGGGVVVLANEVPHGAQEPVREAVHQVAGARHDTTRHDTQDDTTHDRTRHRTRHTTQHGTAPRD